MLETLLKEPHFENPFFKKESSSFFYSQNPTMNNSLKKQFPGLIKGS